MPILTPNDFNPAEFQHGLDAFNSDSTISEIILHKVDVLNDAHAKDPSIDLDTILMSYGLGFLEGLRQAVKRGGGVPR